MKKNEGLNKTVQPLPVLTMRKTLVILLSLVAFSVLGHAQQPSAFQPHWSVEGQVGGSYTLGEGSFGKMLSPSFSVLVGYRFSEPVGVRFGVGGLSGKGYVAKLGEYYKYDFVRTQADFIFHSFGKVKNLYTLVGVGLLVGTSNGALAIDGSRAGADYFQHLWKAPKAFAAGRFGVGYRFPVGPNMAITAEAVYHLLPDALNSVHSGTPGSDVQALVGFHYSFGRKKAVAPRRDYTAEARAAIEARSASRQEVPVEEPVEEPEEKPAEKPAEVPVEVPVEAPVEAAPVTDEATSIAIAMAVAEAAGISDVRVYFESNSWTVQSKYEPILMKVADFLSENPGYLVKLTAYCDNRYGTPEYNQEVSERRANAVARFLKRNGVPDSRILTSPAGGTDSFSSKSVKQNRFVVCEIVKEL